MKKMDTNNIYIRTFYGDEILIFIDNDRKEAHAECIVPISMGYFTTYHVMEYKIHIYRNETLKSILTRVRKAIIDHREEWEM